MERPTQSKMELQRVRRSRWTRRGVTRATLSCPRSVPSANALDIIRDFDIVVNGSDNFPTRYLVNDACYLLGKPLVDGTLFRFEGRANVFLPGKGCYRCLFPSPPPPGAVPSCAEAGVLGAM